MNRIDIGKNILFCDLGFVREIVTSKLTYILTHSKPKLTYIHYHNVQYNGYCTFNYTAILRKKTLTQLLKFALVRRTKMEVL